MWNDQAADCSGARLREHSIPLSRNRSVWGPSVWSGATRGLLLVLAACSAALPGGAHVTLRPNQPLTPGGFASVSMNVPSERHVPTVSVTLEVPDAFLNAGGRLSRIDYPDGWHVTLHKEAKPGEVFAAEMKEREERPPAAQGADAAQPEDPEEARAMEELRKQWIKRVTFTGGNIPPDGFKLFQLSFQLPEQPGTFRFPATQVYADGKEVAWSEIVEGAEHPAPSLAIEKKSGTFSLAWLPYGLIALTWVWMLMRGKPRQG